MAENAERTIFRVPQKSVGPRYSQIHLVIHLAFVGDKELEARVH